MSELSRRDFSRQSLGSIMTWSLLETVFRHDAFAADVRPLTREWLRDLNELGSDVREQRLQQVDWQRKVEELLAQVDLPDLLKLIDFEQLTAKSKLVDKGARSLRFNFPKVEGIPEKLVFGKQIFAMKQGRSVVPHGHNNMATAFLVLSGELQGRHYDRLEDAEDHFIIRPTIDRKFSPGEFSTVSDYRDNIHWFESLTEPAYLFNIHVLNVRPGSRQPTGRVYLDPKGEKLSGGLIKAPRLGYKEVHELYG